MRRRGERRGTKPFFGGIANRVGRSKTGVVFAVIVELCYTTQMETEMEIIAVAKHSNPPHTRAVMLHGIGLKAGQLCREKLALKCHRMEENPRVIPPHDTGSLRCACSTASGSLEWSLPRTEEQDQW